MAECWLVTRERLVNSLGCIDAARRHSRLLRRRADYTHPQAARKPMSSPPDLISAITFERRGKPIWVEDVKVASSPQDFDLVVERQKGL